MMTNHVVDQLRDTVPRPVTDRAVVVAVSGTSVFSQPRDLTSLHLHWSAIVLSIQMRLGM